MKQFIRICRNYGNFLNSNRRNIDYRTHLNLTGEHNLKDFRKQNLFYRYFASDTRSSLSEKSVKNLLEHATSVYEGKEKDKCEIKEVLEIQEVEVLVQERLKIVENIRTLEELSKFYILITI